jgi:hypothetical protein
MFEAISNLHDATLLEIRFSWAKRECELHFSGAPAIPGPFSLVFGEVTELHVPSAFPWGASVSVLEASAMPIGRYSFSMQSGDTITVVAPNYAFKPTAGEVCRTNQPLLAGGGLTRR